MYGDGSVLIHVQPNQTVYMEYEKATSKRSNPKVNFLIEELGELITVNDLRISGDKSPSFNLQGSIKGVRKLTLSASKVGHISKSGSITAELHRNNLSTVAISLGSLTLEYGAKLTFSHGGELDIGYLTMRQKTLLSAQYFDIKSTVRVMEDMEEVMMFMVVGKPMDPTLFLLIPEAWEEGEMEDLVEVFLR